VQSGELARLAGISTDTLRHYERLGLLPKPPRTDGGYRNYLPNSVERVRLIRRALTVGFSLPELTIILKMRDGGEAPCRRVQAMAQSKLEQVKQQMQNLVERRNQLEAMLKHWNVKLARTRPGQPARRLEDLPSEVRGNGPCSPFTKKTGKEAHS
jgi:MerR family transcriptional regulator, copper efflux regulator